MKEIKESKCWTCKHGVCIKESNEEHYVHPAPPGEREGFDNAFSEEPAEVPMHDHIIQTEIIKTFCFWRPKDVPNASQMMNGFVDECNRYEKG